MDADGHARKRPGDFSVPEIGVGLTAGQALRQLAYQLLETAAGDIEPSRNTPVLVPTER